MESLSVFVAMSIFFHYNPHPQWRGIGMRIFVTFDDQAVWFMIELLVRLQETAAATNSTAVTDAGETEYAFPDSMIFSCGRS